MTAVHPVGATPFWKMSGSGNDFVFFDARGGGDDRPRTAAAIAALCDRRHGIGADGVVYLEPATGDAALRMAYYNSDGSRASMCGNAALCTTRLAVWLGDIDALPTEKGAEFATKDGVAGVIRSYTERVRVRIGWQPEDWPHDTTLQLTVKEAATGTTIGIHQEKLADREERKLMLGHWKNVAANFDIHFRR